MLVDELWGTGLDRFVARAHERLADTLQVAGFDAAMKTAPHTVTVRTTDAWLVWYTAISRSKTPPGP